MTDDTDGGTSGSLPPEPVEERESVSSVTPEDYPDPANGKTLAGEDQRKGEIDTHNLNDGTLSSSEMQDAGMGEDEATSQ